MCSVGYLSITIYSCICCSAYICIAPRYKRLWAFMDKADPNVSGLQCTIRIFTKGHDAFMVILKFRDLCLEIWGVTIARRTFVGTYFLQVSLPTTTPLKVIEEREVHTSKVTILTGPSRLESESSDGEDYRAPNLLQRVLSLFKSVRPGTDLTRIQLSPMFNMPKSQLQCYGEAVYCINKDLLRECANGKSSLERFISVVSWTISTTRPIFFGVAPYNPILGETHHASRGSLNVLLEQVSHHPPVSALHATDEKNGIEMIWCHRPLPKFNGTSVETLLQGERKLKLVNKGENYIITHPNLVMKFVPFPGAHWLGNVKIGCKESGFEAEISFGGNSFLSSNRSIRGKIYKLTSLKTIYEIDGHWDRTVSVKDVNSGKITVIYNAKEVISGLKTPILKDPQGLWTSESALVWGEVNQYIINKSWDKAREAKTNVEERQRQLAKERKEKGETWIPKHFTILHTSTEGGWDCLPIHNLVPKAPIVVPT